MPLLNPISKPLKQFKLNILAIKNLLINKFSNPFVISGLGKLQVEAGSTYGWLCLQTTQWGGAQVECGS